MRTACGFPPSLPRGTGSRGRGRQKATKSAGGSTRPFGEGARRKVEVATGTVDHFRALPSSLRKGKRIYTVNENNSLRQRATPEGLWESGASPPGIKGVPQEFRDYPDDNALKMFWGTVC